MQKHTSGFDQARFPSVWSEWPTSQFLNETHDFLELVLARMALLMDQSCPVLPLRSAKAQEFGELWREKCTRAPWTFPFELARTGSFSPARTNKWKATQNPH